jgi:predicted cupin superfamily sugar epimerase
MTDAKVWIDALQLRPHPEGGYYRETYRAGERVERSALPARFSGDRAFSTAIYYLLQGDDFSALHRIKQDEVWHFYDGSPITVHVIDREGNYSATRVGRNPAAGELPQAVVAAVASSAPPWTSRIRTPWRAAPWRRGSISPTSTSPAGKNCVDCTRNTD